MSPEHQQDEIDPISAVSDDDTVFDEHGIHICQLPLQGGGAVPAEDVLAGAVEDFLWVAPPGCGFRKHVSPGKEIDCSKSFSALEMFNCDAERA